VRVRVDGKEVEYPDVEMLEVRGEHNLEALVPPAF
jgi:hypothetical protein